MKIKLLSPLTYIVMALIYVLLGCISLIKSVCACFWMLLCKAFKRKTTKTPLLIQEQPVVDADSASGNVDASGQHMHNPAPEPPPPSSALHTKERNTTANTKDTDNSEITPTNVAEFANIVALPCSETWTYNRENNMLVHSRSAWILKAQQDDAGYLTVSGIHTAPTKPSPLPLDDAIINNYKITRIGEAAFKERIGLTSVRIPAGVTNISAVVFAGCTGLTSVTVPADTSIGDSAFPETVKIIRK